MSVTPESLPELTSQCLMLARLAGERIMAGYEGGDFEVVEKADQTPLTTADLEAHKIIEAGLSDLEFKAPVLSEESASIDFSERTSWTTYWLVDPLDGTREFIRRSGEFSVNIALIDNGEPVLGVVYAPVLKVAYYAARGQGAWKQVEDRPPRQINVRKAPADSVIVARSRSPVTGPSMKQFLEKLGQHEELPMGSALKSCLVAEGVADVYPRLGPTSEWDTGAAQCVVEEAGGYVKDLNMQALRYNTRESLINPHFLVFGCNARNWASYLPDNLSLYPT